MLQLQSNVSISLHNNISHSINPKSKKLIRLICRTTSSPVAPQTKYATIQTNFTKHKATSNFNFESSINTYSPPSSPKHSNNTTNNVFYIQTYDVDNEEGTERPITPHKLFNMQGMSQIFLNNTLFIFGSPSSTSTPDEFTSSFLYTVNVLKEPLTMSIEVNSCHSHFYPTLTILKNEFLIAIGGYNSKHCEYYSIVNKKWKELPDLVEERYGASALCDNNYNHIYVFGGLNSQSGNCGVTVLKLNVNICVMWETIVVMYNAELFAKMNTSIVKRDDGKVMILGGCNSDGDECDDVVSIDLKGRTLKPKKENVKLDVKGTFISLRNGAANGKGVVYVMDDGEDKENVVHKVEENMSRIVFLDDGINNRKCIRKRYVSYV